MKSQVVVLALFLFSGVPLLDAQEKMLPSSTASDLLLTELRTASLRKWENSVARSSRLAAKEFISAATPVFLVDAFPDASAPSDTWVLTEPTSEAALPRSAAPAQTRSRSGDEGRNRFEMALGYNFVRFRSAPITANISGLNSSLAYFPWGHIAVEANTTTAFGSEIFDREHTKFLFYGGGLKYVEPRGQWEPWAHVLVGGVHMLPQTALGGQNGFGIKAGGGIDYNWPRQSILWIRAEGNYIRSQLYSTSQNNFMISGGIVFRLAPD